jgi:hypothetical protein
MIIWHSTGLRKVLWEGFIGWLNFRQRARYIRSAFSWRCHRPLVVQDFTITPAKLRFPDLTGIPMYQDELLVNTVDLFRIRMRPVAPFVSIEPDTRVKS